MKNTIKMSLVAAVAVAGFSTTASAGNLEEMIKGVTMSGKMSVGYTNVDKKLAGVNQPHDSTVEYDIDATLKAPVNDNITATLGFQADHDNDVHTDQSTRRASGTDDNADVDIFLANFTYANGPVTAIVGKQTIATPFTDDEKGDGILALYNAGPVVLGAGHFVNSNIDLTAGNAALGLNEASSTTNALAVIAPNIAGSGINASAWYVTTGANLIGTAANTDGATAWTIAVDGKIADMVTFDLRHSSAELDGINANNFEKETLTKLVVGADLGMVALTAGYATTNDVVKAGNGTQNTLGRLHGVEFNPGDTAAGFSGEQAQLDTLNDADAFLIGASTSIDKFGMGVTYIDGDAKNAGAAGVKTDFSELLLNASYAMSKNFTVSSYYSMYETKTPTVKNETDEFNIALTYKF